MWSVAYHLIHPRECSMHSWEEFVFCCCLMKCFIYISSVQSLSGVQLFATPWITARQASLSITNSQSSLKLMSLESVMPSSHLILCHPFLLLPLMPLRIFSNESTLCMMWPKYWSFSLSIIPSNEHPGLVSKMVGGANSHLESNLPKRAQANLVCTRT